jgi:hypothetical protein
MPYYDDEFTAVHPDGRRVTLRAPRSKLGRTERIKRRRREREEFEERERLIKARERGAELFRHYLAKAAEVKADHDVSEDPKHAPAVEHHASKVADLLVESGRHPDRAAALDHLLHSSRGQALLRRMNKKDDSTMTDNWTSIAKDHGIVAVAKMITNDGDAHGLGEHEFTQLLTEHAKREHPDMTPDQAFSKIFGAETEEGQLLRQAHGLTKSWPAPMSISPTMVGGSDAFPSAQRREGSSPPRQDGTNRGGESSAYDQLVAMAARQRKEGETASAAFMRVYTDPANASLAEAERAQNRPAGGVRIVE